MNARAAHAAFLRRATGGNSQQRRARRRTLAPLCSERLMARRDEDGSALPRGQRAGDRLKWEAIEAERRAAIGPTCQVLAPLQRRWLEFLSGSRWVWFITLTWASERPSEEVLKKTAQGLLRRMHVDLFGQDFREKIGLRYAIAFERVGRGRLHIHLLVSGGEALQLALWKPWATWWQKNFGRIEFDRVRGEEAVLRYVTKCIPATKYVTKDGLIERGETWTDEAERLRCFVPMRDNRRATECPCKRCGLVSQCRCNAVHENQLALFQNSAGTIASAGERSSARFNRPEPNAGACTSSEVLNEDGAACTGESGDQTRLAQMNHARAGRKADEPPPLSPTRFSPVHVSANKTVAFSSRCARRRARYHTYMSRSGKPAVVCSPAAAWRDGER